MQWFKHDTDASTDARIKKLILRYGPTGYAVYFHCLELIAGDISESNITFELEHDAEIIADDLKVQGTAQMSAVDLVNIIMRYIVELGLFEEQNSHIFCFKMLKRLDSSMTSNPKMRSMIASAKENHDGVMMESCSNHDTIMQEENRIEEIRLDKKKEEKQPVCVAEQESPKSSGVKRIEAARLAWNERAPAIGPTCRLMAITFKPEDTTDCLRIMNAYSDAEIIEAMDNYCKIRESQDHEVKAPYQSFVGFIRSGVEKFITESDPWTAYKRRMTFDEMQEAENRRNMIAAGLIPEEG